MDPMPLSPEQWDIIVGLLVDLTAAVALALAATFAFVLGRAVLPAVAEDRSRFAQPEADRLHGGATIIRRLLYPVAALATVATLVGLGRAVISAVDVIQHIYPRTLI